ncbi:enzymatic polyprotein, putative [Rhizophagus irregularis DAOM 181602=DAOM 197198]|nr:enzymatic polyprotein, putative [Rhizophagus irregularis DAOM 181602=DAOM 197198]
MNDRKTTAMKADLEIENQIVSVIIDTGAAISVITDKLRRKLGIPILGKSKFRCTIANGEKIEALGKVRIIIRYEDELEIEKEVEVIDSSEDLILENDIWKKLNVSIDFENKEMRIERHEETIVIPISYEKSPEEFEDPESSSDEEEYESDNERTKHKDILEYDEEKEGRTRIVKHKIEIEEGVKPIKQKRYKETEEKSKVIREEVDKLLKQGKIRKSNSPWSSPVTLAKKKTGKYRFCIDYRQLNKVTIQDSYPLPRIDELLEKYRKAKWFSSIDLAAGFHQIEMDERDKAKTAFVCAKGLYEYNVMPFGLTNAPATFQRVMDEILEEFIDDFVVVYIDDIMIFSENLEDHMEHLEKVLKRLQEHNLIIKLKKCKFLERDIEFLEHIVGNGRLRPDEKKIEKVQGIKEPETVKEVRSFLGLCSYYRKFVENFSKIAKPLTSLVKKETEFIWGEEQQKAFDTLKEKLTKYPILQYPNYEKEFILITDASGDGAEKRYPITELEYLAVIWGVKHFHKYLVNRRFKVITDHAALKGLMSAKIPTGRRARWVMELQQYNFEIIHRPGKENKNADALSRLLTMKKGKKPMIVIIYGVDGVGKTSVVTNLIKEWEKQGLKVRFNTFKRRRGDNPEFEIPKLETEWKFRKEVVEQINRRMLEFDEDTNIVILDKSPYCEYFYQRTKSFDRGLITPEGNHEMEKEIFRYKDLIDKAIVIFLENNNCWENYIGRETKKGNGGHKSSYDTLKKEEYMDMVRMFKEHQNLYTNTKKYSAVKIKND